MNLKQFFTHSDEKNLKEHGFIQFAQIGRPHGLKGGFFLKTEDRRTEWDNYRSVLVEMQDGFCLKKVLKSYLSKGCLALCVEGLISKEQIDALYNKRLYVHKSEIKLKKDEYLVNDITGYAVYDNEHKLLGHVVGVISFGAQDNLQIKKSESQEIILFPFIEKFVTQVDAGKKTIEIVYVPEFFEE